MIRSFLLLLPATLVPRMATFAVSLLGANLLPATEFGYFAIVVVIGEMSEMAAVGWTRVILIRYGSDTSGLKCANLHRVGSVSLVSLMVAMIGAALFSSIMAGERFWEMTAASLAYIGAFSSLRIGLTLLQVEGRKSAYTLIESLRAPAYLATTVAAMNWSGSFFWASFLGSAAVLVFGFVAFVMGWRGAIPGGQATIEWKTIRQAGVPIILVWVLGFVVSSLDKTVLSRLFSKDVVAAYAIAFALGRQGFDVLANAINIGEFPRLVHKMKEEGAEVAGRQLGHTIALIFAVALPAFSALVAARDLISEVLLPESYWPAVHVATPIVAVGAILLNLKNFAFDNIFHVRERNYLQLPTIASGAAASVAIAVWSPSADPFVSAALIFLTGALVSLTLAVIIGQRLLPMEMPWLIVAMSAIIALLAFPLVAFCATLPAPNLLRAISVAFSGGGAMIVSVLAFVQFGRKP